MLNLVAIFVCIINTQNYKSSLANKIIRQLSYKRDNHEEFPTLP